MTAHSKTFILGGGMTGLAAGMVSGLPVLEAASEPGGICSSYYMRPGETKRHPKAPADGECYRFEIGGGHWIFGGDPDILAFIDKLTPSRKYNRVSSVYFPDSKQYVPYPLQNHLRFLNKDIAQKALSEMSQPSKTFKTMKEWLNASFGPALCALFFDSFHHLYTGGLYDRIIPQDAYKSPVNMKSVLEGASQETAPAGYNATFIYPEEGLGALAHRMAKKCDMRYGKKVIAIDIRSKTLFFADQTKESFERLFSTLPLNKLVEICSYKIKSNPSPYTSVLVLNIGAQKGKACPPDHWLYVPRSRSKFHRVGFYSNVDASFIPVSARKSKNCVSLYIERAFPNGIKPPAQKIQQYSAQVVQELQEWGFIEKTEVVDPTWIDVAYTWTYPESDWRGKVLTHLSDHKIFSGGRYGRWHFQGIAESIKEGFEVGEALKL
jgi:protoporphyrinogen oxidase